jgi:hypothetical protein
MNIDLSFWKAASPKRKRIYSTIFVFVLAVVVTLIGTLVPLSAQDAQTISNELNQTLTTYRGDFAGLAGFIFLNNFSICLLMFVPVVGTVLGLFILFSTGTALGAISMVQGIPVALEFALLAITPIFWLEFIAYSIGINESIWLFRRLMQKRWRELKWAGLFIAICAGLLAIGAVVEAWLIIAAGV